jgi:methionine synthase II (cobalamin-independent)
MEKPTVEELAMAERKFLHDLANHIVVAHGMSTFVHRAIKENKPLEEKDINRLERAIEAINKMTALLKDRRTILHSLTE